MSKSNALENAWLLLLLNNTNIANIGDATGLRGSSAPGNLYVSLHTADPDEAGDQTTNEAAYTNYARVAVARSAGGWTITGNSVSPTAPVVFPTGGAGASSVATHFAIGALSSGAGMVCYKGPIAPTIPMGNGITPQLTTATAATEN